ncbi:hypothetical protein QUF76_14810 [Desulfobacterales bacterium HSG16]|nr:hypothetical protein [Desulfobacterales bacterium HSG16]
MNINSDVPTALLKRIRRHVIGKKHEFFISTSPGLEKLCLAELMELPLSEKDAKTVFGGVEFFGKLYDCYIANLCLRTANRILMRMAAFKAESFRQLEKKLADIPWELYLYPDSVFSVSVTSKHSRLYHSDAVAERFKKSIRGRFSGGNGISRPGALAMKKAAMQKSAGQENDGQENAELKIFVRIKDDMFSVSMDSSGQLLHKRGIIVNPGKAPIRETIAAGILKTAGYTGSEPLVDPMCGSGTFSVEGAMMAINAAPCRNREFAFMNWPSFMPQRWNYLLKETDLKKLDRSDESAIKPEIFASDRAQNMIKTLEKDVRDSSFADIISVNCRDFFEFSPKDLTHKTGLVVINPPYGRRIGSVTESRSKFQAIVKKLAEHYNGWKFALIASHKDLIKTVPFAYKTKTIHHGGLKLTLLTGYRKQKWIT